MKNIQVEGLVKQKVCGNEEQQKAEKNKGGSG